MMVASYEMWDFLALGLGEPVPVSALHGRRAGDLLDVVLERLGDRASCKKKRWHRGSKNLAISHRHAASRHRQTPECRQVDAL